MYRQTKNEMTFDKADRIAMAKHKKTLTFFDEAFYFEMVADHIRDGGSLEDKVERVLGL